MIRVWVDNRPVGTLDRFGPRGSTFVYDPATPEADAISLTMPKRTASWDSDFGIAPIFQMNLPEGELRERLTRQFAKATGRFDDYDLLTVVGGTQIGRLRFADSNRRPSDDVPFQSIHEILTARRGGELFDYLMSRFAEHSGISGVQPKVMVRGADIGRYDGLQSATHIIKLWSPEYPELATNEYLCLEAARRIGLPVPACQISDDGLALVLDRFDRKTDGTYLGFEDFCVLNGFGTDRKYDGGYESRLFKRAAEFVSPHLREQTLSTLFQMFVLNCAIRNGDAHLKNFGVTYASTASEVALAPVYDLITTTAYIPVDRMALTLEGSTEWPDRKKLVKLGQTRANLALQRIEKIFAETDDILAEVAREIETRFRQTSAPEIGRRMLAAWEAGRQSLRK